MEEAQIISQPSPEVLDLFKAIDTDDYKKVTHVVEKHGLDVNKIHVFADKHSTRSVTPLGYAVMNNKAESACILIDAFNAHPNQAFRMWRRNGFDWYDESPLSLALIDKDPHMVRNLLHRHCDPNQTLQFTFLGQLLKTTPFVNAFRFGAKYENTEWLGFVLRSGGDPFQRGHLEVVPDRCPLYVNILGAMKQSAVFQTHRHFCADFHGYCEKNIDGFNQAVNELSRCLNLNGVLPFHMEKIRYPRRALPK